MGLKKGLYSHLACCYLCYQYPSNHHHYTNRCYYCQPRVHFPTRRCSHLKSTPEHPGTPRKAHFYPNAPAPAPRAPYNHPYTTHLHSTSSFIPLYHIFIHPYLIPFTLLSSSFHSPHSPSSFFLFFLPPSISFISPLPYYSKTGKSAKTRKKSKKNQKQKQNKK